MPYPFQRTLPILAGAVAALAGAATAAPAAAAQETAAAAPACAPARTALVLGGGGAKGLAHVGVFRALDSAGVRPDLVVGTSIGAITGALYASGYTGREIDSLTRAMPIGGVVHGYEPRLPGVLADVPAVAVLEQRSGRMQLQTGAVRESEVNALMSALMARGNVEAAGDFDRMPIPFRAVAADITTRTPVVLARGDLARAVRASFALPVIFEPVHIDGRLLNDGGMASNVPIDVARSLGADRVIVSMLPSRPVDASQLDSPFAVVVSLVDALVRNELLPLGPDDILIRNATDDFDLLDFGPAASAELVKRGYEATQAALAGARCVRPLGDGAAAGRTSGATVTIGRVSVTASARAVRPEIVTRALGTAPGRRVRIDSLQARLLSIGETGRYQALWLYPSPDTLFADSSGGRVALDLMPVPAPSFSVGVGAAFDGDMSGRAWAGFALPELWDGRVDAGVEVGLGRYRQDAALVVRPAPGALSRGLTFPLELRVAHEDVRRFVPGGELPTVGTAEASAFAAVAGARGPLRWALGPVGTTWYDDSSSTWRTSGGARARLTTPRSVATRLALTAEVTSAYRLATLDAAYAWTHAPLTVQPFVRAGWGDRLPLQRSFPLGGTDGFPGLRIGEWRGERMANAGFTARWALLGPVAAELELAGGAVGAARDLSVPQAEADEDLARVIWGGRLGVRIETPAGAIRVAEGVNSLGRHALFLRLGRWY